jgi:serine protease AprX
MQDNLTQDKITHAHSRSGRAWRTPAMLAGFALPLAALPLFAMAAPAGLPKTDAPIAQLLTGKTKTGFVSVIFKTTAPLTSAQEAQMTTLGASIIQRLPIIQSVTVRLPEHNLAKLAALPFAAHLSLDGKVQKSDEFTVGSSEAAQATATFGTGRHTQTYKLTGVGVTVAVLDSGITPVADLSSQANDLNDKAPSRLLTSVNFSSALTGTVQANSNGPGGNEGLINLLQGGTSTNTYDPCGHGTHVAGIIAGNGSRSPLPYCTHTFQGIAPQANLISVRVLDQDGCSDVSTVLAGLQYVLTYNNNIINAPGKNKNMAALIRVVNMSLGHPVGESYTTDPICQAVEALYQSGVVVVCAAGNEGRVNGDVNTPGLDNEGWGTAYGSIQSPGNDPYVITVGATKSMDGNRADDRIATYSSRGPSRLDLVMKPDIIAAGNKVISLDANGSTLDNYAGGTNDIPYSYYVPSLWAMLLGLNGSSPDYFQLSGTSMASPVVAGAAALMLQANPNLSPDTIKARLMLSADKWFAADGTADPLTYGSGYLNIPAALASTVVAQGAATSPALTMDPNTGDITIVMDRAHWGTSLWGTGITDLRAIWGSRALWGSSSIDMTSALWGSNTTFTADRAHWGTSTLLASQALYGSSIWGDRAHWGTDTTAVDLNSAALSGE